MQIKTLATFKSEILRTKESRVDDSFVASKYLLVLQPHQELNEKIVQVKKDFAEKYNCPDAVKSKPHITLVQFAQYDVTEPRIVTKLRSIAHQIKPFKVELTDFRSFPSHTIYFNVSTKVQIVEAVREIRQVQRLMKMDKDNKPFFITEPHLTVARKLLPWQYEKGWLELSNTHFSGRFMANEMVLLKRGSDREFNKYKEVERFAFKGEKSPTVVQTALFDLSSSKVATETQKHRENRE